MAREEGPGKIQTQALALVATIEHLLFFLAGLFGNGRALKDGISAINKRCTKGSPPLGFGTTRLVVM